MPYQSKKAIASMISGAVVLAAYCIYAFGRYSSGAIAEANLRFWAATMLIFIGLGIAVTIILQIVFHVALSVGIAINDRTSDERDIERKVEATVVEDEMDRLIELKSLQVGFVFVGVGFVSALILLVLGHSTVVMLNVMYLSFLVGSLIEGAASLYFYGKGVSNG